MTNIVVTGFMGTGKTAVGQQVARRLSRPFVDMDEEIEARAGKPIARIFTEDGEAVFRQMEAVLCKELSAQDGLVIATGGGTLVDSAHRTLMMRSGIVICLTCGVDEILRRVKEDVNPTRPLLNVADRRAEVERLLQVRREAYAALPWQVDTTQLSIEDVVTRVMEIVDIVKLPVRHPDGQYEIHIGNRLLAHIGEMLRAIGVPEGNSVALVSNSVVAPLYSAQVEASLRSAGLLPFVCPIPDGESNKTLATVAMLYEQFLAGRLSRSDTVVSLGGGVTGDIAGFAAATYMRGVRFVQLPTTLLAMVDASVGSKTGVDLPQGKNLVGAFKQPALVAIDPTVLATLPAEEIRSGLAEVIKHGIIGAPNLFTELEMKAGTFSSWWNEKSGAAWIARSLRVKITIVTEDPFEQGQRAMLNLGHTVGHALEKLSGFALRHGEAISIGMVAAARIAVELGLADLSLVKRIEAALLAWGLPVRCPPFEADAILEAMDHDKKRRGITLRWALPCAIGETKLVEGVALRSVTSALCSMGARLSD